MMVDIGTEYRFTLNLDMPWPFTQRKTELLRKMVTANQIAERPLVSQSRGGATNSLWGRDWPSLQNDKFSSAEAYKLQSSATEAQYTTSIMQPRLENFSKFLAIDTQFLPTKDTQFILIVYLD